MRSSKFIVIVLMAVAVAAVSAQGSVTIQGTVAQKLELNLDFDGATIPLDLETGGSTSIGTATLISNLKGGYTITITSSNAGVLKSLDATNIDTIPYTFTFGGTSSIDLASPYTLSLSGKTPKLGTVYAVSVEYDPLAALTDLLNADNYRDVITFAIAAP